MTYLFVAAGGALGSTLRYWLSGLIAGAIGQSFPWGTLVINISGSIVIGAFATLTGPDGRVFIPGDWRQFFMVGVCGGYTTFSSFSLQTLTLAQEGQGLWAAANVVLSVVFCLIGVWLGHVGAVLINEGV
ncbi:fluoride efflux transporter CrcB [Rhodospirillum rubrum]|uniref:Fluoride-specific ion channel FluC n=1 Tax=Rhodospirillum rubrum (strain ATCC 11170 / ATH 1.1.1 / DSM 467 / LMG 4362 / NCIMB 8255 / S1) TaxID=269796 RepID=FLUC_RHORT|nr:fluoride efflux transporter CrcB [Rhodospirillum rubrum]Q2RXV4.1 RecName: Full=Fluoride-specific ion channel FluC [Rhodospirillum rubrum ATCC 11170]ABC21041.1 camphor resistance protein CrcB [Rhodospirillum rubrum ATCC 11170]AEO46708.1 camphor resistance protein CrcB [Rhodospirillum rubrum F11]MBK5952585.1 camphor resistance protein CrcB [Rhodospirillum rubrum]QXG80738.1 fluoride efflux transporter CrcB [Rhodospirillum rubrum]HAQ00857.1 fluoride efflux transporter CrcB [Rhodospirillum rubr